MTDDLRTCPSCGATHVPSPARLKGRDNKCRACKREMERANRQRRKAAGNPVVTAKMPREYHQAYSTAYFADPKKRALRNRRARKYTADPLLRHRHEARWKARRAIQAGRIVRCPCEVCGAPKVHAHHDDYGRPLDVRWLCPEHHREHHAKALGADPKAGA